MNFCAISFMSRDQVSKGTLYSAEYQQCIQFIDNYSVGFTIYLILITQFCTKSYSDHSTNRAIKYFLLSINMKTEIFVHFG